MTTEQLLSALGDIAMSATTSDADERVVREAMVAIKRLAALEWVYEAARAHVARDCGSLEASDLRAALAAVPKKEGT